MPSSRKQLAGNPDHELTPLRPIAVDLFAGAGGLSLGFEQAGFDVLAAIENDPIHCATHKYNFPYCNVICKSVSDVTGERIRELSGIRDQEIAVVFGGSPCQGYSLMGKRALDDPRNALVLEFLRLVKELKPRCFVFENVPGLMVGKQAQILVEIVRDFEESGYLVTRPYKVLNALEYGVPQGRQRLFLMGTRAPGILPSYPLTVSGDRRLKISGSLFRVEPGPSVWDAIGDLPEAEDFDLLISGDSVRAPYGPPSVYASYLRDILDDASDYGYRRIWDPSLLTSSMRTVHTQQSVERFSSTKPGHVEPVSRFLRLDPQGVCNTLRAGTGADRGAFTSARPIHPFSPRCITVREAARLHSYPDWFRFHCTKWHGFRQVGNSVPPLLARAVASSVAQAMGYIPNKPTIKVELGDPRLLSLDLTAAGDYFALERELLPRRKRVAARA